ncbi:MAG: TolC family protein [Acidobacteriota bacterium]
MKALRVALCLWAGSAFLGGVHAQTAASPPPLPDPYALMESAMPAPGSAAPALTLDEAERIALTANPDIAVAAHRLAVAQAHLPIAGALDDPEAMYRGWGVPLEKPWDFNAAQNMFSLSQALPGGNRRALRTNVAASDVDEAKANLAAVRLNVEVRVCKAFYDLLLVQDELRIHADHVGLARQTIEAARIKYAVGNVPQQDLLKAEVALTALSAHMIRFTRDEGVARARLNALLDRDPAAPLLVEGKHAVLAALPSEERLESAALGSRPDLAAARAAVERSRREQTLAKKAYAPDFTVSGGYMLMPAGQAMRNSYMVEGSMNLPWLNHRKHDAEIAEATAKAGEQDTELAALRNTAREQIGEALVEAQAAQRLALFYHDQIRPQAEATLQSSVIAYQNNQTSFLNLLDSQMAVIDIDVDWIQAVGDFDERMADLELATGIPLDRLQPVQPEVKP